VQAHATHARAALSRELRQIVGIDPVAHAQDSLPRALPCCDAPGNGRRGERREQRLVPLASSLTSPLASVESRRSSSRRICLAIMPAARATSASFGGGSEWKRNEPLGSCA